MREALAYSAICWVAELEVGVVGIFPVQPGSWRGHLSSLNSYLDLSALPHISRRGRRTTASLRMFRGEIVAVQESRLGGVETHPRTGDRAVDPRSSNRLGPCCRKWQIPHLLSSSNARNVDETKLPPSVERLKVTVAGTQKWPSLRLCHHRYAPMQAYYDGTALGSQSLREDGSRELQRPLRLHCDD
jgi:hypothetical protein